MRGFRESRFQMFVRAARSVEQELDFGEVLVEDPITHPRSTLASCRTQGPTSLPARRTKGGQKPRSKSSRTGRDVAWPICLHVHERLARGSASSAGYRESGAGLRRGRVPGRTGEPGRKPNTWRPRHRGSRELEGRRERNEGGWRRQATMRSMVSSSGVPGGGSGKGGSPVNNSKKISPSRVDVGTLVDCVGGRRAVGIECVEMLGRHVGQCAPDERAVDFAFRRIGGFSTARLKSSSIGVPSAASKIFDGFKSRWSSPRAWACSRPSASRATIQTAAWIALAPRRNWRDGSSGSATSIAPWRW